MLLGSFLFLLFELAEIKKSLNYLAFSFRSAIPSTIQGLTINSSSSVSSVSATDGSCSIDN